MIQFKQNNKSQISNAKQIPPTGVSGETITKISNSKQRLSEYSLFRSLGFTPKEVLWQQAF